MRIALDMDEIITEYVREFLSYCNKRRGFTLSFEDVYTYDLGEILNVSEGYIRELFRAFESTRSMLNMEPVGGSQEASFALSGLHELVIVTSRLPRLKEITKIWINYYFPLTFSNIYFSAYENLDNPRSPVNKAEACKKLRVDLMVDDNAEYVWACAEAGISSVVFDKPWNRDANSLDRVYSWKDITDMLID